MGMSWVLSGRLVLRPAQVEAWLAEAAQAPTDAAWPALLAPNGSPRGTVGSLLDELARESPSTVAWSKGTLTLEAVLPDDSGFWAFRRAPLAVAFVRAGALGARGELVVGPASDNTTASVVRVTVAPEGGAANALRGAASKAAQKQLRAVEIALSDARAEVEAAQAPLVADPDLRPVYLRLVRRLAEVPGPRLLAAAAAEATSLPPRKDRDRRLAELYPTAPALLRAFAEGDARLEPWASPKLVATALSVLLRAAPEAGLASAREVLAATGGRKVRTGVASIRDVALAAAASDEAPETTLAALRGAMPSAAPYGTRELVRALPLVTAIARDGTAATREAVRVALRRTLGGPAAGKNAWKKLSVRDACFAGVLAHLLTTWNDAVDAELLAAVRSHPNALVA